MLCFTLVSWLLCLDVVMLLAVGWRLLSITACSSTCIIL